MAHGEHGDDDHAPELRRDWIDAQSRYAQSRFGLEPVFRRPRRGELARWAEKHRLSAAAVRKQAERARKRMVAYRESTSRADRQRDRELLEQATECLLNWMGAHNELLCEASRDWSPARASTRQRLTELGTRDRVVYNVLSPRAGYHPFDDDVVEQVHRANVCFNEGAQADVLWREFPWVLATGSGTPRELVSGAVLAFSRSQPGRWILARARSGVCDVMLLFIRDGDALVRVGELYASVDELAPRFSSRFSLEYPEQYLANLDVLGVSRPTVGRMLEYRRRSIEEPAAADGGFLYGYTDVRAGTRVIESRARKAFERADQTPRRSESAAESAFRDVFGAALFEKASSASGNRKIRDARRPAPLRIRRRSSIG